MTGRTWTTHEIQALGVRTDVETAGSIFGMGRTKAHEFARRGEFPVPVLRLGARYVVPVAPILRALAVDAVTVTSHDRPQNPDTGPSGGAPTGDGQQNTGRAALRPVSSRPTMPTERSTTSEPPQPGARTHLTGL